MTPLAVRELASFVFRHGDLYPTGEGRSVEAWEGSAAHNAIQQRRKIADPEYRKEVRLKLQMKLCGDPYQLQGRVDGITVDAQGRPAIEEYKTSRKAQPALRGADEAQAWLYAGMLCLMDTSVESVVSRVIYISPEGDELSHFSRTLSAVQAKTFVAFVMTSFEAYLEQQQVRGRQRIAWAEKLVFPYPEFRKNQRAMAGQVYKSICSGQNLLLEAATGSGKTMAILFPALKAQTMHEQFFFLTSRNRGADAALKALEQLTPGPTPLRAVHITAKEKTCPLEEMTCDAALCPNASSYYNRLPDALNELSEIAVVNRQTLEACAAKHSLCPFELSLDTALNADIIVGDYNYVFDPAVRLQRFLQHRQHSLLIDETHQLSPRVNSMLSVEIRSSDVERALNEASPALAPTLQRLQQLVEKAADETTISSAIKPQTNQRLYEDEVALSEALKALLDACDSEMSQLPKSSEALKSANPERLALRSKGQPATGSLFEAPPSRAPLTTPVVNTDNAQRLLPPNVLAVYFTALRWQRSQHWTSADNYRHIVTTAVARSNRNPTELHSLREIIISRSCINSGEYSAQIMAEHRSVIRFSGTVSPANLYQHLHGQIESDNTEERPTSLAVRAQSPFSSKQLRVLAITDINTFYRQRQNTLPQLIQLLATLQRTQPGRYIVAMPSYEYLQQLASSEPAPSRLLIQSRGMTEPEQHALLQEFLVADNALLGIVMGGVFGESIDLGENALDGVVVVSLALPPADLTRTLTSEHFDQLYGEGWGKQVAYLQPALARVLQAAGRVIRGPEDNGLVCLVDPRFADPELAQYFPEHWDVQAIRSNEVENVLNAYWSNDLSDRGD